MVKLLPVFLGSMVIRAAAFAQSPMTQPAATVGQSPALPAQYAGKPLSLEDALAVALSNNPLLARAGENLQVAQGRVGEARSALYPTLAAGPGESYLRSVAAPAYAIQATVPIDISHLLEAATDQAHFQEVGARLDVNRARNEVVYGVEHAYYAALRAQALVKVALENQQDSAERLRDAQAQYNARVVAYLDVVRAQTESASADQQVIQARSNLGNQLALLANSLGIEVTSPLTIADAAASAPAQTSPRVTGPDLGPEFKSVLNEALTTRPEILESDAAIAAARKGILVARRSELPSVQLGVGYYDLRAQTGTQIREPQAFVGLSFPLYDGGLARARVAEARATVASAVTARRQTVDAVTLDVQQAYLAVLDAQQRIVVARQAVIEAQTAYSIAQVRYKTGVSSHAGISPLLELSDAQAALTLAEQNEVNSRYDYREAQALLARAAGRFAFVPAGPGYPAVPAPAVLGKPTLKQ